MNLLILSACAPAPAPPTFTPTPSLPAEAAARLEGRDYRIENGQAIVDGVVWYTYDAQTNDAWLTEAPVCSSSVEVTEILRSFAPIREHSRQGGRYEAV